MDSSLNHLKASKSLECNDFLLKLSDDPTAFSKLSNSNLLLNPDIIDYLNASTSSQSIFSQNILKNEHEVLLQFAERNFLKNSNGALPASNNSQCLLPKLDVMKELSIQCTDDDNDIMMDETVNEYSNMNACMFAYRGELVAGFEMGVRRMICLPQVYELFLKQLVGGLHTIYTKLKRLNICPVICNVEQVRALRSLGAIQAGVNRCKLIETVDFDKLYEDCTNMGSRPGRPPKRCAVEMSSLQSASNSFVEQNGWSTLTSQKSQGVMSRRNSDSEEMKTLSLLEACQNVINTVNGVDKLNSTQTYVDQTAETKANHRAFIQHIVQSLITKASATSQNKMQKPSNTQLFINPSPHNCCSDASSNSTECSKGKTHSNSLDNVEASVAFDNSKSETIIKTNTSQSPPLKIRVLSVDSEELSKEKEKIISFTLSGDADNQPSAYEDNTRCVEELKKVEDSRQREIIPKIKHTDGLSRENSFNVTKYCSCTCRRSRSGSSIEGENSSGSQTSFATSEDLSGTAASAQQQERDTQCRKLNIQTQHIEKLVKTLIEVVETTSEAFGKHCTQLIEMSKTLSIEMNCAKRYSPYALKYRKTSHAKSLKKQQIAKGTKKIQSD